MNLFLFALLALPPQYPPIPAAPPQYPVAAPPSVVIPDSTIAAAVALHQAAKAAPVAAPILATIVESPCANGNCSTQRRGLFGRRR